MRARFQQRPEQEARRTIELTRISMDVFGGLGLARQWLSTPWLMSTILAAVLPHEEMLLDS